VSSTKSHRASSGTDAKPASRIAVQSAPITREIAERRRRVAFCELFTDYPREAWFIYEQQRAIPAPAAARRAAACAHPAGTSARGYISRERIIRYRATQLLDDLARSRTTRRRTSAARGDAARGRRGVEKHVVAEGTPSVENCADAVREGREARPSSSSATRRSSEARLVIWARCSTSSQRPPSPSRSASV
jgi:hypothetical protein